MEETIVQEKFTLWDCYLKGNPTPVQVETPPTKVSDAIDVVAKLKGWEKKKIGAVMAVLT